MRCPKCSYVSFDLVESCVKCGKNISGAAIDLQGTVAGVELPTFLRMSGEKAAPEAPEETAGFDTDEEPLDLGTEGEEEAMDLSFDDEPSGEAGSEEVEMDFGRDEDAEAAVEIDLSEEEKGADEAPQFDLGFDEVSEEPQADEEGAIGISDLAPDEEVEKEFAEVAEEVEATATGQGLEDLQVEGIDLESAPGMPESGKVMPSVKTGTALDDFDIDLGDLLTGKKD